MQHPNAIMATSSADRISTIGTYQPYQNFRVQTAGGNIVQGQLNKIRVGEIMFPYDIPTVVQNRNDRLAIAVAAVDGPTGAVTWSQSVIIVPAGFYTSTELNAAITAQLSGILLNLTLAVDPISGAFYFTNSSVWDPLAATNYIYFPVPASVQAGFNPWGTPQLLWTLGFKNLYSSIGSVALPANPAGASWVGLAPSLYPNVAPNLVIPTANLFQAVVASPYNGRYTDYIDICSPALCQAQYVRDGNTQQSVIHRDIICRLYVANEISTYQTDPTGDRPFVIHRQFKNAKVMKWTADRSIDAIDIQLYDMWGLPLPDGNTQPTFYNVDDLSTVTGRIGYSGSRDFAITFLVDEPGASEQGENVGYRY